MSRLFLFAFILVFQATVVHAAIRSSQNFQIERDSLNSGGLDSGTSTNYQLRDTLGQIDSGRASSTNYIIEAGYREGGVEQDILGFSAAAGVFGSRVTQTSFGGTATTTVTVSSASGFAVGDTIIVVQDEPANALVASGLITNIQGTIITVDAWTGDTALMTQTPSGGDDYVYNVSASSINFGTLTPASVTKRYSVATVSSTMSRGFTLYIAESSNLISGANDIDDVGDGLVTAGQEEYGIEVVGNTTFNSDIAITSSLTEVASSTRQATDDRTTLIHKVSISPNTPNGSYAHTLSYYLTPRY